MGRCIRRGSRIFLRGKRKRDEKKKGGYDDKTKDGGFELKYFKKTVQNN